MAAGGDGEVVLTAGPDGLDLGARRQHDLDRAEGCWWWCRCRAAPGCCCPRPAPGRCWSGPQVSRQPARTEMILVPDRGLALTGMSRVQWSLPSPAGPCPVVAQARNGRSAVPPPLPSAAGWPAAPAERAEGRQPDQARPHQTEAAPYSQGRQPPAKGRMLLICPSPAPPVPSRHSAVAIATSCSTTTSRTTATDSAGDGQCGPHRRAAAPLAAWVMAATPRDDGQAGEGIRA